MTAWRHRHPEWPALVLAAVCWPVFLLWDDFMLASGLCGARDLAPSGSVVPRLGGWMAMVGAMMLPLAVPAVRVAALRSLPAWRPFAVAAFIAAYAGPWLLAGLAVLAVEAAVEGQPVAAVAGPVALAVAALWQLTPAKRGALRRCHRTLPVAPRGRRGLGSWLRYGAFHGTACVGSCWALMAAAALTGHGIAALVLVGSIGAAERFWPLHPKAVPAVALAAAASFLAVSVV